MAFISMELSPQNRALAERLLRADWTTLDLHTAQLQTTLPDGESLSIEERGAIEDLFISREYALRAGITVRGDKYPVHQWEKTRGVRLVYGRRGDAVSGSGACVFRAVFEDGLELYGAITYKFPSLSTNAVAKLLEFVHGLGNVVQEDPENVGATIDAHSVPTEA